MEALVAVIWLIIQIYLGLGILFSIYFLTRAIWKLDDNARNSPWTFRITILSGVVLLWVVLAYKLFRTDRK